MSGSESESVSKELEMGFGHEKPDAYRTAIEHNTQWGSIPIPIPTPTPRETKSRWIANHWLQATAASVNYPAECLPRQLTCSTVSVTAP